MKTLYLSDVDQALICHDKRVSGFTARVINRFMAEGGLFSLATGRSVYSAMKVTKGLNLTAPGVFLTGAMINDPHTHAALYYCSFGDKAAGILDILLGMGACPLVYSLIDNVERFSFINHGVSANLQSFLDDRPNDTRRREVSDPATLLDGDVHLFNIISTKDECQNIYHAFKGDPHVYTLFHKDAYHDDVWFTELLPTNANKGAGALKLKEMLGADRIIAFGDDINDLPLFAMADEAYAVANAHPDLKAQATAIIGHHNDDAIAKFISSKYF